MSMKKVLTCLVFLFLITTGIIFCESIIDLSDCENGWDMFRVDINSNIPVGTELSVPWYVELIQKGETYIVLDLIGVKSFYFDKLNPDEVSDLKIGQKFLPDESIALIPEIYTSGRKELEVDQLTGFNNFLQDNITCLYGEILFPTQFYNIKEIDQKLINFLTDIRDESKNIEDERFDYYDILKKSLEKIDDNLVDVFFFSSNRVTEASLFVYPEKHNQFIKPAILINYDFLKEKNDSLIISSVLRSMYLSEQYFKRIGDNIYTDWDDIENTLYLFDAYYMQARFVEDFFINRGYGVSRFESYLFTCYEKDLLQSFFYYYYGLKKDLIIKGCHYLEQLTRKELTITEFLNLINDEISLDFFNTKDFNQDNIQCLISKSTLCSYYKFYLNHKKVKCLIDENSTSIHNELILLIDEMYCHSYRHLEQLHDWVNRYQLDNTLQ